VTSGSRSGANWLRGRRVLTKSIPSLWITRAIVANLGDIRIALRRASRTVRAWRPALRRKRPTRRRGLVWFRLA
jgi:hypothetical protein